jgi:hypothetical protein
MDHLILSNLNDLELQIVFDVLFEFLGASASGL